MMNEKFRYFKNIEQGFRRKLSAELPVVVRFDGKNVTKNHKRFHLMDTDGFSKTIFEAAKHIAVGSECSIFAALDEVSIVFHNPSEFFAKTQDRDLLYSAIMILQDFLCLTRESYPDVKFNISVFSLEISQIEIEKYLKWRKEMAYSTAITYIAKEKLSPDMYHQKRQREVIRELKKHGIDIASPPFERFLNGFDAHTHSGLQNSEIANLFDPTL